MAGRKVMKTFSIDYEMEEKLKKIPSKQSFLVNALLKYFFETCERKGIDWQTEIFKKPEKIVEEVLKENSPASNTRTEKESEKTDIDSFWDN